MARITPDFEELLFGQPYVSMAARVRVDPALGRALDLLEADYGNRELLVSLLARAAGMSETVFREAFHRRTGFSPNQFLMRYRVMKAGELAIATDRNMLDIALCVGLGGSTQLWRGFRSLLGAMPKEFRRKYGCK